MNNKSLSEVLNKKKDLKNNSNISNLNISTSTIFKNNTKTVENNTFIELLSYINEKEYFFRKILLSILVILTLLIFMIRII